jgi:uncharacterized protein YodC (DUF2158 family)
VEYDVQPTNEYRASSDDYKVDAAFFFQLMAKAHEALYDLTRNPAADHQAAWKGYQIQRQAVIDKFNVHDVQPANKYLIGDIVHLNSGSPAMTVVHAAVRPMVLVQWADGDGSMQMASFPESSVHKATSPTPAAAIQVSEEAIKRAADVLRSRWLDLLQPEHASIFEDIASEMIQASNMSCHAAAT